MKRTILRFVLPLLAGLMLVTLVADRLFLSLTRSWFAHDAAARSRLAVASARNSLVSRLHDGDTKGQYGLLSNLTHDKRILAVGLCSEDGRQRLASTAYPSEYSCPALVMRWRESMGSDSVWELRSELPSGPVLVSLHPLEDDGHLVGWVSVVQDLSQIEHRETMTRGLLLAVFFLLGLVASAITAVTARFARQGWMLELRRVLRQGNASSTPVYEEFHPLLRDVRELVDELASERAQVDGHSGAWSPERLRAILRDHLHGDRIVALANREPYIHERQPDGSIQVSHPASGLVTALEPLLRACSGTWVAHGSGNADHDVVDSEDRLQVPPDHPSYTLRRVWLSEEEENGYYYGFANEGLWPLCHVAHTRPFFRTEDWKQYRAVNRRFAEAVCREADSEDPVVLVQDYHFALAPRMIREMLPQATILTFWHIPWPNAERFGICPWHEEIIDGLLGSSIVGFHTQQHCNQFLDAVDAYLEARIDHEENSVVRGGRTSLVRPYPISIAWPDPWTESQPPVEECRARVLADLGLDSDVRLGIGVDRLDYTKGIEERLRAVDRLLETFPEYRGKFTFVQIGAPSRSRIPQYQALNEAITRAAEEINARWTVGNWRPLVLLKTHHEPKDIYRYYRAADLCYVSSLHDGMNLVAKEYVAARDDEAGCLVLSRFTGAARELTEALIVNPYDLDEAARALAAALRMPVAEARDRMRSMRHLIASRNIYRWAGKMLLDASELRRRERLSGRLTSVDDLSQGDA